VIGAGREDRGGGEERVGWMGVGRGMNRAGRRGVKQEVVGGIGGGG